MRSKINCISAVPIYPEEDTRTLVSRRFRRLGKTVSSQKRTPPVSKCMPGVALVTNWAAQIPSLQSTAIAIAVPASARVSIADRLPRSWGLLCAGGRRNGHYPHCGDRFNFLKSGSKLSERHSFASAIRLGNRSTEFFVGDLDLPCLAVSKNFRSCGSCQ
jgi:hypothetical protein